jgi:hypothetical protein
VTDETLISFKELQSKYQLLLAENRLLKAELDTLKAGLSDAELQQQEEPCLSHKPENIIQPSATESSSDSISYRSESAEKIDYLCLSSKGGKMFMPKGGTAKKRRPRVIHLSA